VYLLRLLLQAFLLLTLPFIASVADLQSHGTLKKILGKTPFAESNLASNSVLALRTSSIFIYLLLFYHLKRVTNDQKHLGLVLRMHGLSTVIPVAELTNKHCFAAIKNTSKAGLIRGL